MSQPTYAVVLVIACTFGVLLAMVNGIDALNSWLSGYNLFRRASDIAAMFLTAFGLAIAVTTIILFARRRGSNVRSWFSEPEQRTTEDED